MKIGNGSIGGLASVDNAIKRGDLYVDNFQSLNVALPGLTTNYYYSMIKNGTSQNLAIFEFDTAFEINEAAGEATLSVEAFMEDSDQNVLNVNQGTGNISVPRNLNGYDINKSPDCLIKGLITASVTSGAFDYRLAGNFVLKTSSAQSQNVTSGAATFFNNGRYIIIPKDKYILLRYVVKNNLAGAVTVNILGRLFFAMGD